MFSYIVFFACSFPGSFEYRIQKVRLLRLRQSLGTKNQDPPESLGGQSWFRILGAPKIKKILFEFFGTLEPRLLPKTFWGILVLGSQALKN